MKRQIFAGIAAALSIFATNASAASVTCATQGQPGSHVFSIDDALQGACLIGPHDFAADVNALGGTGAFGFADWILAERNELSQPAGATQLITFDEEPVNGAISGTLSITTPLPSDVISVMVSLKTSKASGLFLMDLTDLASAWSIFEPGSVLQGKELSHSTLFYRQGDIPQTPLPAGVLLLLTGVGALVLRGRKTT